MSSRNGLVWMPTGEHQLSGSNSQPTPGTALWADWWLTNSAQRFPTYRALFPAISVTVYQMGCHKHVYHPFPNSGRYPAATIQYRSMHTVSVSSLVGWTSTSHSGQNYSPHVSWDHYRRVGLEVQLVTLKVSLHVPFKSCSQKPSPAWWDHVSFYRQRRSDPNGEQGHPEQKPNLSVPEAFSLFTAIEPLQILSHFMLPAPKTLLWISEYLMFFLKALFLKSFSFPIIIYFTKYIHTYIIIIKYIGLAVVEKTWKGEVQGLKKSGEIKRQHKTNEKLP